MRTTLAFALALAAVPLSFPVTALAAGDGAFLIDAMKADNDEVAMGKLAAIHGASTATRAYGQMLAHDHAAHRMKLAALARSMGVPPTTALSGEGMKSSAMMKAMHRPAFDAAFKQDMIDGHQKNIAKYEEEANSAQSPKLRQLAHDTLPTLHKHLDAANAL